MHHAAAGGEPLHVAAPEAGRGTERVRVVDQTLAHDGDGLEAAVRVLREPRDDGTVVHVPAVDPGEVHADVATLERRDRGEALVALRVGVVVVRAEQERVDGRPLRAQRCGLADGRASGLGGGLAHAHQGTTGRQAEMERGRAPSVRSRPMTVHERPFGRYFEDFEPDDVYRHWPGKTITEYDDHLFCMITMNHHPLHTDAWYAETQTQFGKNVVVGNLVYSLVLGMSVPDVSGLAIANLEIETLQHKRPTFHGDTIYAETRVLEKKESSSKPDRGIVTVETFGYNQRGEEVCYFKRKVMVPKREAAKPRMRPYPTD